MSLESTINVTFPSSACPFLAFIILIFREGFCCYSIEESQERKWFTLLYYEILTKNLKFYSKDYDSRT
jgi:hypothetical protein